jgi:DNA replicative helicase MCM subunit Mcm2 (Cdc46/Mcm family)
MIKVGGTRFFVGWRGVGRGSHPVTLATFRRCGWPFARLSYFCARISRLRASEAADAVQRGVATFGHCSCVMDASLLLTQSYVEQAKAMLMYDQTTMYVDFMHITTFDVHLAEAIVGEYYRFEPFIRAAVEGFVREQSPEGAPIEKKEFFVSFFNLASQLK